MNRFLKALSFLTFFVYMISFPVFAKAEILPSITSENTWFLDDINATDGWEYLSSYSTDFSNPIIVAVIDTGVDYTHPLIQNALWTNTTELHGTDGVDDDANGYTDDIYGINTYAHTSDPMDDSSGSITGHGTHVAGSILLTSGVTLGTNPYNIRLMPIKAGDAYGNFNYENVAEALYYAADNGADVINMSLSTTKAPSFLQEALSYAQKSAVIIGSAGNKGACTSDSGYTNCADYYPAGYPSVIGVMSYNKYHNLSYFSNWDFQQYSGAEYEIAAPGENIYSCYYNGAYKNTSGTSMAAGIVSGCAALLRAKYNNQPAYSAADLTAHIMEYEGDTITYTDNSGIIHNFHRLNLYKMLSSDPSPSLKLSNISGSTLNTYELMLSYTLFNRGYDTSNAELNITWNAEDGNFGEVPLKNTTVNLSPLERLEQNITISLPENVMPNQWITFSVTVTCQGKSSASTFPWYLGALPTIVEPSIPLQGITVSAASSILRPGETLPILINYIPENTTADKTLEFSSNAPDIVSVDTQGIITALSPGSAVITITAVNGITRTIPLTVLKPTPTITEIVTPSTPTLPAITCQPIPTTPTVTSRPKTDIRSLSVRLSSSAFSWNNRVQKPTVAIKGLKKNKDYTVTYSSPSSKNAGNYCITIKGKGNYVGTVKKYYKIYVYKNKTYTINGLRYKITSKTSYSTKYCGTVTLAGAVSKKITKLNIKDTIKIGGKTYKITAVKSHAFQGFTKLKHLTIGKNLSRIGSYAFDGDKRLKSITTKSKNITYIGKRAFRNIHPKAKPPKRR